MPLPAEARALVWLKRDLRMHDHAPLSQAASAGQAVALYLIEPAWLASPEFAPRHAQFALAALHALQRDLALRGLPLHVQCGEALAALQALHERWPFTHLLSHEETGPGWSYARDIAVAAWCKARGVQWIESPQTGVVRRLKSRNGWAARWQQRMDAQQVPAPARWLAAPGLAHAPRIPTAAELGLCAQPQAAQAAGEAGEAPAHALLHSFLHGRGIDYRRALSSPLTAEQGCSRLSPHLAFGTLSMRQVHQASAARFAGRLRWHCHFMQKLEDEPTIESRNLARQYDGLRPGDAAGPAWDRIAQSRLDAWASGHTGYPMVDACMRSLNSTGWLNFRMRAMLVSFASYHLWLHWRPSGLHLARQFTDFEAGIHWPQMQMQSGTTAINTLRMYSPTKQAQDQDAQGLFIRRWVPELQDLPDAFVHAPWRAPRPPPGYPAPIIDERAALAQAKAQLYGLRQHSAARAEAAAIQQQHGSRKSGLPPSGARKPAGPKRHAQAQAQPQVRPAQGDLFET